MVSGCAGKRIDSEGKTKQCQDKLGLIFTGKNQASIKGPKKQDPSTIHENELHFLEKERENTNISQEK